MKLRIWLYILLAFVLWFVMFVLKPFNFWVMMAFSTSLLSAISLYEFKDQLSGDKWNSKEILIGIGSAVLLYLIFWFGRFVLDTVGIIPGHSENISNVYANRGIVPPWIVGFLLFFPIGFGEEVFWRGCIQRYFNGTLTPLMGLIVTVAIYTAVHIPTMNFVLILAAFLVGIYWGLLFNWRKNIIPGMISHMIWDPLIFIILPLN